MGMDNAHPFLLTGPCQERTEHFKSIDVHEIFVEIPAADIVLRAHFVSRAHPGEGLDDPFHAAFGTCGKPNVLAIYGGAFFGSTLALHLDFIQEGGVHDLRGGGPWQ